MVSLTVSVYADDRPARPVPPGDSARDQFLKRIERPRVPLNPAERSVSVTDGMVESNIEFDSEAGERVPALLMKLENHPEGTPLPVVIVLHGTGGSKTTMKPWLQKLAAAGVIAVAMDARFSGHRMLSGKGTDAYRAAILETWKSGRGFPFIYDTVWDVQRLLDYLQTRPDVDPRRIGAIGFSKGGIELYLAAAVDTRLAASVSCIGVQSFHWAVENNAWHSRISTIQSAVDGAARDVGRTAIDASFVHRFYDRVAPGIDGVFDGPQMLPLIAPRPLLVINGDRDDRTPIPGLQLCISAARQAYLNAGASENLEFRLQPNVGHAVTPDSEKYALEWLLKHLK